MGKPFLEQNRPAKVKEIYRALKRDHPNMSAGKKARIASAAGKRYLAKAAATTKAKKKKKADFSIGEHAVMNLAPIAGFMGAGRIGKEIRTRSASKLSEKQLKALHKLLAPGADVKGTAKGLGGSLFMTGGKLEQEVIRPLFRKLPLIGRELPKVTKPTAFVPYAQLGKLRSSPIKNLPGATIFRGSKKRYLAGVASHELGHAANYSKFLTRLLQRARAPALLAGVLGSSHVAGKEKPTKKDVLKSTALMGIGAAPLLAEEGLASIRGLRGLKQIGLNAAARKAARANLLKAWGTYAAVAAGMVGGMGLGAEMRRRRKAKESHKKRHAKTAGIDPKTIHRAAEAKGITWDAEKPGSKAFVATSKRLTGKGCLDKMNKGELSRVLKFVKERPSLKKTAASVKVLRAAARRLGTIRTPMPKGSPTEKGMLPLMAAMGGGVATIPKANPGLLRALGEGNLKAVLRAQGMRPDRGIGKTLVPEMRSQVRESHKRLQPLFRRYGGTLLASKGDTAKTLHKALPEVLPAISGKGRKASNIAFRLHEGFERKALGRKKEWLPGHGHLSPRVIMDETNLMKKMTGPGSAEARRFVGAAREMQGETAQLMGAVRQAYGQRGVDFVKKHGFSKAMKKDLMNKFLASAKPPAPPAPKKNFFSKLFSPQHSLIARTVARYKKPAVQPHYKWGSEKRAVAEYLREYDRPALQVKAPPSKGGSRYLTLANYPEEVARRYPKLTKAKELSEITKALRKKFTEAGGQPENLKIDARAYDKSYDDPTRRGAFDANPRGKAMAAMRKKERIAEWVHPRQRGSAFDGRTVTVRSLDPTTIGHEVGHAIDEAKGKSFGERGFFGIGGKAKTMIPSEVSATEQALRAGGKTLSKKEMANILAATGTYIQSSEINPKGEIFGQGDARHSKYQEAIRSAARRAGVTKKERLGPSVYDVERRLREEGKIPTHDTLKARREARAAKDKPILQRVQARKSALSAKEPSWSAPLKDTKLHRRRMKQLADLESRLADPSDERLQSKKELRTRRLVTGMKNRQLDDIGRKAAPNPFRDPLWQHMTAGERKATQGYVEHLGGRLGQEFGPERGAVYKEEMMRGLQNPTRRGFRYVAPPIPKRAPVSIKSRVLRQTGKLKGTAGAKKLLGLLARRLR